LQVLVQRSSLLTCCRRRTARRPGRSRRRRLGELALGGAAVGVDLVAVVAGLAGLLEAVAAGGELAGVGAGVEVDMVGVVALLDAHLDEAVAAEGGGAVDLQALELPLLVAVVALPRRPA
jgi:hypothetical protein